MIAPGITDSNSGARAVAALQWRYSWEADFRRAGKKCAIKSFLVHVDMNYVMPKWTNQKAGSKGLRRSWKVHYAALVKHENYHVKHTMAVARKWWSNPAPSW